MKKEATETSSTLTEARPGPQETLKGFAHILGVNRGVGLVFLRTAFGATGVLGGVDVTLPLVVMSFFESGS